MWGADRQPLGQIEPESVRFLLVHHTASANDYREDEVAAVIGSIYDFHTGPEKGWPDVAYHFFVDRFGGVWEGRQQATGPPVRADATGGNQGYAQLVCLLGDFTSELPTSAALDSLNRVLAWLADRYGIDTAPGATIEFVSRGSNRWASGETVTTPTIAGHRDMSNTACPGDTFYPYLVANVAREVTASRAGQSVGTTTTIVERTPATAATASPEDSSISGPTPAMPRGDDPGANDGDSWNTEVGTIALIGGLAAGAVGVVVHQRSRPDNNGVP